MIASGFIRNHLLHGSREAQMTAAPLTAQLRDLCGGRVHLPGDPGYDAARTPWDLTVDQKPAAVAIPHSAEEVAEVVRAAVAAGLRVAPQGSGHGAGPLASVDLSDVVLLRLNELTGVSVDADTRVARVAGGSRWGEVVSAASPYGLTALHSSSPGVGVAGYTLNGGVSYYGRAHGLAANSVVAIEVVTADGSLVRASATENTDLFWALRGGGGNFGVVVALEIELLAQAEVYAGMLLWPLHRADEVAHTWATWTRGLPDSVSTSLRVMSFPPVPDLPPVLSGLQLVVVNGAVLEDDARATELLAALRDLEPTKDTFARVPSGSVLGVDLDPVDPTPGFSDHAVIADLSEETIDALLDEVTSGSDTSLLFAELRHLGGALGRPARDGGVTSHLDGDYLLFGVANAPTPESIPQARADVGRLCTAIKPWITGTQILNFGENGSVDPSSAYGDRWERLRAIRATVDPTGVFLASHPIE